MTVSADELFGADNLLGDFTVLDVRSPGEYAHGRLPGAVSLPLFDDEERAEVGTLYKQVSPDEALLRGLDIAGGKMRSLVEAARAAAPAGRVVVHCWRGGQRSGSVAWLLRRAGMEVAQLEGGYKAFRKYARTYLATSGHRFRVLSGPTGSKKTEVLRAMQRRGAAVIDLEALARHKGSSFGALGEPPQPTTEQFENQLFAALRALPTREPVWLEDESRMIGTVYQPDEFYHRLTAAPVTELLLPLEWRVDHLVTTYAGFGDEELQTAFRRIRKKLGGQHLSTALDAIDTQDYAAAARVALVYYDKAYAHYTERRGANVVARVEARSAAVEELATQVLTGVGV